MDYLVSEGYPAAAKKFAAEAGIQATGDSFAIRTRVEIKNAIHRGDIQTAIDKINYVGYQVSQVELVSPLRQSQGFL